MIIQSSPLPQILKNIAKCLSEFKVCLEICRQLSKVLLRLNYSAAYGYPEVYIIHLL